MVNQSTTLVSSIGTRWRGSIRAQGKAYADYGILLDAFAAKKVGAVELGRGIIDLYIGTVSNTVSAGAGIVGDVVQSGVDRFSKVRGKAGTRVNDIAKIASPESGQRPAARKKVSAKATAKLAPATA